MSPWGLTHVASRSLLSLGARIGKVALGIMALVAVISELGYPVTSLIAGLGIGGLAFALASQKTVENLFGAFSIGVDQPFCEGDFIKVEDFSGTVEAIGLRSTRIRTLDRTLITVPNGKLAEMRIETFAVRDRIRLVPKSCQRGTFKFKALGQQIAGAEATACDTGAAVFGCTHQHVIKLVCHHARHGAAVKKIASRTGFLR
jgi:hypothetical protein